MWGTRMKMGTKRIVSRIKVILRVGEGKIDWSSMEG